MSINVCFLLFAVRYTKLCCALNESVRANSLTCQCSIHQRITCMLTASNFDLNGTQTALLRGQYSTPT
ncbi:hypothetical protein PF010_g27507 [Phytophthora fragariae]|uniref:Secreted protein n=1 Tax=Phytophthora fragariae TaxID=53985 RepID=A0A6A3HE85_9STRA|nr:hypothetical protein PF011_g27533 [Phytophthora fragariae]KAE9067321.1 hypothetical protein PF010_g27507 [Phytophthora fragariae]